MKNLLRCGFVIISFFTCFPVAHLAAQELACVANVFVKNGTTVSQEEAISLLNKKQREYKKLKKSLKVARASANLTKIKKLQKKIKKILSQIKLIKSAIELCGATVPVATPTPTPTQNQNDDIRGVSVEHLNIPGYKLSLYRASKSVGVVTQLINNQGDVATKLFGPVTGLEKNPLAFADTKGTGYIWRDNKAHNICTNSFCNPAHNVTFSDITPKGLVLFNSIEESAFSQTNSDRKIQHFVHNINTNQKIIRELRLTKYTGEDLSEPENLLDTERAYAGFSSPTNINQWDSSTGNLIGELDLQALLSVELSRLEGELLNNLEAPCTLTGSRKFFVTFLKVADNGELIGKFSDSAECVATIDSNTIKSDLPAITSVFRVQNQVVTLISDTLYIPRFDDQEYAKKAFFMPTAVSANGIAIGINPALLEQKNWALIMYPTHSEAIDVQFAGVDPGLLEPSAGVIHAIPAAINQSGNFVGTRALFYKDFDKSEKTSEAYFSTIDPVTNKRVVLNLDTVIPKALGFTTLSAAGINDCGAIVGGLKDLNKNEYLGYRLAPTACGH